MEIVRRIIPLSFISNPDTFANAFKPFSTDVKTPARTITNPCPNENKNNISPARAIFALSEANPIIPARIGVEQGVEASAKIAPMIRGYSIKSLLLF